MNFFHKKKIKNLLYTLLSFHFYMTENLHFDNKLQDIALVIFSFFIETSTKVNHKMLF